MLQQTIRLFCAFQPSSSLLSVYWFCCSRETTSTDPVRSSYEYLKKNPPCFSFYLSSTLSPSHSTRFDSVSPYAIRGLYSTSVPLLSSFGKMCRTVKRVAIFCSSVVYVRNVCAGAMNMHVYTLYACDMGPLNV